VTAPEQISTGEIEFVAGSADDVIIPLYDANGDPVDLLGWTGRVEIRYATGHPVLLAAWATVPGPGEGTLRLEESGARLVITAELAAVTLLWPWRLAWYDLALRTPQGRPARPHRGIARVIPPITAQL
jgi:hypothetical protein